MNLLAQRNHLAHRFLLLLFISRWYHGIKTIRERIATHLHYLFFLIKRNWFLAVRMKADIVSIEIWSCGSSADAGFMRRGCGVEQVSLVGHASGPDQGPIVISNVSRSSMKWRR